MTRVRAGLAAVLMALLLGVLGASPAHAHAERTGTDPTDGAVRATAPTVATEPVNPAAGAMSCSPPTAG